MSASIAERPISATSQPPLRIVGGLMEASNDTSTQPFVTLNQWGVQTPIHHIIGGIYCWTSVYQYSYGRMSIYLDQDSALDMVVGGKIWANNASSSGKDVEVTSWGNTSPGTTLIGGAFQGYGWSAVYQQGYLRCDLYMAPSASGLAPIGGKYYSTNDTSSAPNLTETFWGLSDGSMEQELFKGYNYSAQYEKGYCYATVVLK